MKSYNGLWDRMLDHEEIKQAILEAAEGKKKRRLVQVTLDRIDDAAEELRQLLENGWTPPVHRRGVIQEGGHRKRRQNIQKPAWWPEQVIHHLVVRQLKPIIIPRMDNNICGTISRQDQAVYKHDPKPKGKGALWASKKLMHWRDQYQRKGKKFYVLTTDIKSFYDTIDINIMMHLLERRIRDKRFLDLVWKILSSAGPGIPKGFYTSPWLAQLFLSGLDAYILDHKMADHYLRYMDNLFLMSTNKRQLRKARDSIAKYLADNLGVSLKRVTQVFRFEYKKEPGKSRGRGIECLGFVIHHNRVVIRKNILKRIRAKAYRMAHKERITIHDASALMSYRGWIKQANVHRYCVEHVYKWVDFKAIRKKLSQGGRRNGNAIPDRPVHVKTA